MSEVYEKLMKCYKSVREKTDFVPEAALILGSGLGDYADDLKIEASINYADIEGFPVSTVKGHKGRFVFAHVEGVPMVIMQGRVHYYEGYPMSDVVLPTRLMGLLGAKKIILTNAAGGVNYNFKPGDFMLITDHITTAVPNPLIGENIDELGTRFPDMSEVYAPELQEKVRKAAEKLQIPLQEGVYMQFTGPSYETPAEIRMCRTWGGDAAGMSTACEAVAANHMGMKVCGISCITNLAAGMSKQKLDHKEVQETADRVSRQFKQLVTEVIRTIRESLQQNNFTGVFISWDCSVFLCKYLFVEISRKNIFFKKPEGIVRKRLSGICKLPYQWNIRVFFDLAKYVRRRFFESKRAQVRDITKLFCLLIIFGCHMQQNMRKNTAHACVSNVAALI